MLQQVWAAGMLASLMVKQPDLGSQSSPARDDCDLSDDFSGGCCVIVIFYSRSVESKYTHAFSSLEVQQRCESTQYAING